MTKRSPISRLWDAGIGFDGSPLPIKVRLALGSFFKQNFGNQFEH